MLWLLLLLPHDEPAKPIGDVVDVLEFNRIHNAETGCLNFSQVILWERGQVVYWEIESRYILTANKARWVDRSGVFREVRFKRWEEMPSDYDREIEDREKHPKDERRGLTPAKRSVR